MKKFILYAIRWQLSTPILWGVLSLFPLIGITDSLVNTIIANLIGASIFFFVDKKIFSRKEL
jgi:hypothetical protein